VLLVEGPERVEEGHAALVEHALFDDLVGPREHRLRDRQAQRLGRLHLMTNSNFVGCSTRRSAGFAPLRILCTVAFAAGHTISQTGAVGA
jgi:hypothetical protein